MPPNMIPQPARRPNQNLWLMLQALDLTANISSTIDDLNLDDVVTPDKMSREDIIAQAEAQAYEG